MSENPKETHFAYHGTVGRIFRIWLVNILLKIVTLGIYSFWGKTRLRRYIVGSFSLLNDRFEYTGTGGELFRGFLKALPIIILVYSPLFIWNPEQYPLVQLIFIPIIFLLIAATYAALRYRLSRTTWRGIRGKLTGSALHYAGLTVGRTLINVVTLGIAIPYSDVIVYRYRANHMHFGSVKVEFHGEGSKLMKINIITLLLTIPTLGISRLWYIAARIRYFLASTSVNNLTFKGTQTAGNMIGLILGNLVILVLTLGLGISIIIQRNLKYFAKNVIIVGDIETSGIHQSTELLGKSGEGMYGILGEQDIGLL
jgi:uncharacterized membrane protein YjgN (DUF898 family)